MAEACGLVMIKKFTYRGDPNEYWANKYWLTGAPPQLFSDWTDLFNGFQLLEQKVYPPAVHITGGYGYNDNADGAHSVWSIDLEAQGATTPGTLAPSGTHIMSGDQAGMVEWQTDRKNSRGKWIYLRKYFHGGGLNASQLDKIDDATLAAYTQLADELADSSNIVGRKLRSQKQIENIQSQHASEWVTTRTLKKRGKRP